MRRWAATIAKGAAGAGDDSENYRSDGEMVADEIGKMGGDEVAGRSVRSGNAVTLRRGEIWCATVGDNKIRPVWRRDLVMVASEARRRDLAAGSG